MSQVSLTVRSPAQNAALLAGNPGAYEKPTVIVTQKKSNSCKTCCYVLILFTLLVAEALLIFFLIPRDPCIYMKSGSGQVSSFTAAPPAFTVGMDVDLTWSNPSYVALGFEDLHLDVYHACCTAPIATVDSPTAVSVDGRSSKDVTVTVSLDSADMPNSSTCAGELVATRRCLLTFKGTAKPIYMGYSLPEVPVEFQQYITR